jgi:hypothetical protein
VKETPEEAQKRREAHCKERAALDRYNAAAQAMKSLHNDYIFAGMRQAAEEARARGIKPFYIAHGDKR